MRTASTHVAMRSKNHRAISPAEHKHIERVKGLACSLCDCPPPSSAHHIRQGQHYTVIALCWSCHQGSEGWHGTKALWRIRKFDELDALAVTIERLQSIR